MRKKTSPIEIFSVILDLLVFDAVMSEAVGYKFRKMMLKRRSDRSDRKLHNEVFVKN